MNVRWAERHLREDVDNVALLPDAVPPVLHEVAQRCQGIRRHLHLIFRRPGLHGDKHDPRVQLFLVHLRVSKNTQ